MNFTEIRYNTPNENGISDGWVVQPGNMLVPKDSANRHCRKVMADIADGAIELPWVNPSTPYQIWHNDIHISDKALMTREQEEYYDNNPDALESKPQVVKDKYAAKKALRTTKP